MKKKLLLVDYENVQKIDLSLLNDSYRANVFVGAKQNHLKAASKPTTAKRFQRVDFLKIERSGKNSLDFHIAFHLGRTIETEPETECFVLSMDKGFDPLLAHIHKSGLLCTRLDQFDELVCERNSHDAISSVICARCGKSSTIEHLGGEWCTNCDCFASPPDPMKLPSNQVGYVAPRSQSTDGAGVGVSGERGWCSTRGDMTVASMTTANGCAQDAFPVMVVESACALMGIETMSGDYRKVVVETYRNTGESSSSLLRVRPLPGQGFATSLKVECSSKMRKAYPVGTRFLIQAKLTDREGGTPFLYSSFLWKYEVLSDAAVRTLLGIE